MGKPRGYQYVEELAANQPLGTGEPALYSRSGALRLAKRIRQDGLSARVVPLKGRWAVAYAPKRKTKR